MQLVERIRKAIEAKDAKQYLPLKEEADKEVARLRKLGQGNYIKLVEDLLTELKDKTETFAHIPETKLNRIVTQLPKPPVPLGELAQ